MAKYRDNVSKAEALRTVGEHLEWCIESIKTDIQCTEDDLAQIRQRIAEGDNSSEWRIESGEYNLQQYKYVLQYWEMLQKVLDKELMF